jgi:hypothetical protein
MSADTALPAVLLTMSQVATVIGVSVNRLRRAVLRGEVVPVARAGENANSAILFTIAQLPDVQRALTTDKGTGPGGNE